MDRGIYIMLIYYVFFAVGYISEGICYLCGGVYCLFVVLLFIWVYVVFEGYIKGFILFMWLFCYIGFI